MEVDNIVSVIVPVFNSEEYLEKCIDSILSQTYNNIELLLVDDGSSDSSGQICDNYLRLDSRVKVFHVANNGAGAARNYGLDHAKGKYVMFVDSDDYIEKNMIEDLIKFQFSSAADVVSSYFKFIKKAGKVSEKKYSHNLLTLSANRALQLLLLRKIDCSPCLKIYKSSSIGNLRFPVGVTNEDFVFLFYFYLNCNKIEYVPKSYYYYRFNPRSVTHSFSHIFDMYTNACDIGNFISSQRQYNLMPEFIVYKNKIALDCGYFSIVKGKKHLYRKQYEEVRQFCKGNIKTILIEKEFSIKYKIKLLLILLNK